MLRSPAAVRAFPGNSFARAPGQAGRARPLLRRGAHARRPRAYRPRRRPLQSSRGPHSSPWAPLWPLLMRATSAPRRHSSAATTTTTTTMRPTTKQRAPRALVHSTRCYLHALGVVVASSWRPRGVVAGPQASARGWPREYQV